MAHYSRRQIERHLSKIRNGYAKYIRALCQSGNVKEIIEFVNDGNVRVDVETILGRALTDREASDLLQAPEFNAHHSEAYQRAHMIALNLKHSRQLTRTVCRENRLNTLWQTLEPVAQELERAGL